MQKADADRQIDQMTEFIHQEAREKAEEIAVKTNSEANAKKLTLRDELLLKLQSSYAKKKENHQIQSKIQRSKVMNLARIDVMKSRDTQIASLKSQVLSELTKTSQDSKYPQLMTFLVAEALMKLMEKEVYVQFRQEDEQYMAKAIKDGVALFQATIKKSTGVTPQVEVLHDDEYLPAGPDGTPRESCTGGVRLFARGGQIVCDNTLDSRLDKAVLDMLPSLRGILFGVRPAPANAWQPSDDEHHH